MYELTEDLQVLGKRLRRAYPQVEPSGEFRMALYQRLIREAHRADSPAVKARRGGLLRAAFGLAALSVAGVTVAMLRGRPSSSTSTAPGE